MKTHETRVRDAFRGPGRQRFSYDGFPTRFLLRDIHGPAKPAGSHAHGSDTLYTNAADRQPLGLGNTNSSRTGIILCTGVDCPGSYVLTKWPAPPTFTESEERARPPRIPPVSLPWCLLSSHWSFRIDTCAISPDPQVCRYYAVSPVLLSSYIRLSGVGDLVAELTRQVCLCRVYTLLSASSSLRAATLFRFALEPQGVVDETTA